MNFKWVYKAAAVTLFLVLISIPSQSALGQNLPSPKEAPDLTENPEGTSGRGGPRTPASAPPLLADSETPTMANLCDALLDASQSGEFVSITTQNTLAAYDYCLKQAPSAQ